MKLQIIIAILFIQSCTSTKNEVIPEKFCQMESFYNQEAKISGKYFYDNKNSLVKFESDWKDFNFSVTLGDQKLTSKFELYSIGTIDCVLNSKMQIISANSSFGKITISYRGDNFEEIIFEAAKGNIINTKDLKWIYNFESEDGNIKKAYLTLGSTSQKRVVFEGISFDDKPNLLPIEARNAQLFRTLINIIKGGDMLDFDYLCKNNILSKKYYRIGQPLLSQEYSYIYNAEGYVKETKYSAIGKVSYTYLCQ